MPAGRRGRRRSGRPRGRGRAQPFGGRGGGRGGFFGGGAWGGGETISSASDAFAGADGYAEWEATDQSLGMRLCKAAARFAEENVLLTHTLLRKYIAYARAHVHPTLSPPARRVLHDFYLGLRKKQRGGDSVPVTARQLESLVRLAEARARMDLRPVVTVADAHDAVAVVKETILYASRRRAGGSSWQLALAPRRAACVAPPSAAHPAAKAVGDQSVHRLHLLSGARLRPARQRLLHAIELQEAFNRSGLLIQRTHSPCRRPQLPRQPSDDQRAGAEDVEVQSAVSMRSPALDTAERRTRCR